MKIKTIMVIDDSEGDHILAEINIMKYNSDIRIIKAYDGEEALDILVNETSHPDVILLDVNMPVMDGYEFLEAYNQRPKSKSVVITMLTSSAREYDIKRSRSDDHVKHYISKPLEVEDLVIIEELLSSGF
jgi:CheY-like chemotaxis protein